MRSEDQAKDDAKEANGPFSELVRFLVTKGHDYPKAYEIAMDAVRGDPHAVSWLWALSTGG